jgi:hypothetical protein
MAMEIHVLAWSRLKNVAWLNLLMESPPDPLDNLISNDNKNIYKQYKKDLNIFLFTQKTTHHENELNMNIHMHRQYNIRISDCSYLTDY